MSLDNFFSSITMKIIGLIGALFVSSLHAEYETCLCEPSHSSYLQIGGNYAYANIKVDGQPSFHGNLGGVQGSYEYHPLNSIYGGLKAAWRQGTTENSFAERKLTYVDVQERIGYTYSPCCSDWSLSSFLVLATAILAINSTSPMCRLSSLNTTSFMFPSDSCLNIFFAPAALLDWISLGCPKYILQLLLTP